MGLYEQRILPHLVHLAMRNHRLVPFRERVVSTAEGRVLEIGIGSGLNLPFYGPRVSQIVGLDPSTRLIEMARRKSEASATPVSFIEASAEEIPLDTGSIDSVVTAWTLCTIPQPLRALEEMRRVLRPDGKLLFVEHGLAPDTNVRKWQDRLTPVWKCIGGGCHLNRPIRGLVESAGFGIAEIDTGYADAGPRPMAYMYEGLARP